jgi:uncharacterized protein (DUF488 family)
MSDAAGHSIFTIGHSNRLRVAIMCAEAMPWRCHRSLIADAVVERGIPVSHILSATRAQAHALPPFARVLEGRVTYPGDDFFADQ